MNHHHCDLTIQRTSQMCDTTHNMNTNTGGSSSSSSNSSNSNWIAETLIDVQNLYMLPRDFMMLGDRVLSEKLTVP